MATTLRIGDFTTLTFDCYGTLIDWEGGILAAFRPWRDRAKLGIDDETLLAAFADAESGLQAEQPGLIYSDLLAEVQRRLGKHFNAPASADEALVFGASVRNWPAFADSAAALAELKKDFKIVILSNVDRASFAHSAKKLGIEFDLVVTAEDVGSYKPDLAHFHVGLERLAAMGVPKAEILHVAQSLFHDHVPAKLMGLPSVWINRRAGRAGAGATKVPAEQASPALEVPSMAAFVELYLKQSAG
jgi:2-haloalkanoic acid dehalogenase type II